VSARCLSCLGDVAGDAAGHPKCLRSLFGSTRVPEIDVDLARFQTFALATIGHVAISGVQRKLSLEPSADGRTLRAAVNGASYILKPPSPEWEALPENEHLTMNLARLSGLSVPPFGLVAMKDGRNAYLVRRFDRVPSGKLACEDFCQLSELPPKDKYRGTAERCGKLVKRYASEPGIEILTLFRTMLFTWWVGDGDTHLKNLSLLRGTDGIWALSPAYDRVCTRLLLPRDDLALQVCGKRSNLKLDTWMKLARMYELPQRAAERAIADQIAALLPAIALVERSWLPEAMRRTLIGLLTARTDDLA
jgi:serine/threonine-protein kinase HipA